MTEDEDALDAEDYLLDSMGDAITLWEALRHPTTTDRFAHFEAMRRSDPWIARESVAQLVEYFQHATAALDAPAEAMAELFLTHCTNAAETASIAVPDDDPFLECLIAYDHLPQAGTHLAALLDDQGDRSEHEAALKTLRDRRDA